MESRMQDQIEGAHEQMVNLCNENEYQEDLLRWAYGKLQHFTFRTMDDALMLDRMKLWLEQHIAG